MVCYIGVGSNLGDRLKNIRAAVASLKKIKGIAVKRCSGLYETEPKGGPEGQSDYFNLVLEVESRFSVRELVIELKAIEKSLGRKVNSTRWGEREIDLDLLLYGSEVVNEADLIVPHPLIQERFFVLKPLNDLAPGLKHPLSGLKVSEMLKSLKERSRWREVHEEIVP